MCEPDRALPHPDPRRRGGVGQPGDRGRDDPLPAGCGQPRRPGRRDRGCRLRPQARNRSPGRRGRADPPRREPRRGGCRAGTRPACAGRPGRRVDRGRRRDHGRDVLAADRRPARDAESARADPGDGHPGLGGRRLLPGRLARAPSRDDEHGHARGGRDGCCLALQRRRDALPRAGGRHRTDARDVLRLIDDRHRPCPARALARGPRQGPDGRRDPPSRRSRGEDGACRARRRGARCRSGRGPAGRSHPGPARREGPGRWRAGLRSLRGRPVDAHGRADPRRGRGRRRGHRRDPEHDRDRSSSG